MRDCELRGGADVADCRMQAGSDLGSGEIGGSGVCPSQNI
jgi:hypothetical protein